MQDDTLKFLTKMLLDTIRPGMRLLLLGAFPLDVVTRLPETLGGPASVRLVIEDNMAALAVLRALRHVAPPCRPCVDIAASGFASFLAGNGERLLAAASPLCLVAAASDIALTAIAYLVRTKPSTPVSLLGTLAPEAVVDATAALKRIGYRLTAEVGPAGPAVLFTASREEAAAAAPNQPAATPAPTTARPIVIISSCKDADASGDARYNGGYKIYNLWVKLLRGKGFQAYIATYDGSHTLWLIEHQPTISLNTVKKWKDAGLPLQFVTGWADATAFIELADSLYYYDCELTYSSGPHKDILARLIQSGKIKTIGSNSRIQQGWHMATWGRHVSLITEWCDTHYWVSAPELRQPGRIGYMNEGPHVPAHVEKIAQACRAAGLPAEFVLLQGDEAHILASMQQCDIFLGLNLGKHPLWGEGCPIPPLEALHAGCVLVAYDVLGNREYLLPEGSGVLISRGDVAAMARETVRLLRDPDRKERLRRQGTALAKSTFTPETCWPPVREFLGLAEPPHLAPLDVATLSRPEIERLLGAQAFIAVDEISVFVRYAAASTRLLEIGAAYGASSFLLLATSPAAAKVWSVDPFTGDSMEDFHPAATDCHANVTRALDGAGQPEALGKWTLLVDDSHSAALDWKDPEPLDFLYLDGDHRYGPVRRDFEDWQGFVRPGGVILLHDSRRLPDTPENVFNRGWPGPTRLARELAQDNRVELVEEVFSLSIFRKR